MAGHRVFLAFMGVLFAPMCGIQVVDYFFFRKQRLDVRGLYLSGRGSSYHFWGGVNPAGVLGLVAGFATYVLFAATESASRT